MPAVPVRATSNIVVRDTNGKLVLVELQGKIECNSGDLSGRTIGELSLEQVCPLSNDDFTTLTIFLRILCPADANTGDG